MFSKGDTVRIKKEWCNSSKEAENIYVVVDVNDYMERCHIILPCCRTFIPCVEQVGFNMIEKI